MNQPGGMTVHVMLTALVGSSLPKWHLSGRAEGTRWWTRCGRLIADWDAGHPYYYAAPIRRLYAGTFAVPCGTCQQAEAAQKRGRP